VDGLEKERDFYFGKLRDIEVICQEEGNAGTPLSESVLVVLYATEVLLHYPFYTHIHDFLSFFFSLYFSTNKK